VRLRVLVLAPVALEGVDAGLVNVAVAPSYAARAQVMFLAVLGLGGQRIDLAAGDLFVAARCTSISG